MNGSVRLYRTLPDVTGRRLHLWLVGGLDRDGNPSVTPEITWRTACYQRQPMLERYLSSVQSAQSAEHLHAMEPGESSTAGILEMDRLRFPTSTKSWQLATGWSPIG